MRLSPLGWTMVLIALVALGACLAVANDPNAALIIK